MKALQRRAETTFSSVGIRPGIPPSSALRCTHLNVAKHQGTSFQATCELCYLLVRPD